MTLHTCQLMLSINHVHYNHIAWTAQMVCLSSLWIVNLIFWSFLHISSSFLHHFLLHLMLEFLPLLSGILGCPCVWQLNLSFTSTHQTCNNIYWTWCICWILSSNLFLTLVLMSSSYIWGVTSSLIKRVKRPLSRVIVLSFFSINFKTTVTSCDWPNYFIIVLHVSHFIYLLSHFWIFPPHSNPPATIQGCITFYLLSYFYFYKYW